MKTTFLPVLIFFILAFSFAKAQKISENKVPQDVIISFKYKYPDAVVTYWEKLNDNTYAVKFKLNEQNAKAEFDKKGLWQLTRFEIKEKELPTPILNYYKENYRNKEYVMSVIELHKTAQGESFYFINLRREGLNQMKPVELHFDLTGKLIYKDDPAENINENQTTETTQTPSKESKDKKTKNTEPNEQQNQKEIVTEEKPDDGTKYIVDASKVPATAKSHFASKVKKATGAVWYFYDNKYTVKFNQNGRNGSAQYTKEGVWIETRIESSEENLHQLIVNYLKENYRQYKIKSVENVTRPKDKSVLVRIYDKRSRQTPPPITEIWFTTTGKFINVDKPDVVDPYELELQKRQEQKDKEFLSHVDEKGVVIENENNYEKVSTKELPTPIHTYIKEYYKEHIIKNAYIYTDDELGNCYLVQVKIEGAKYSTLLYFDIYGKFLKKEEETDRKAKSDYQPKEQKINETEEKPSKYGTPEERVNFSELPSDISKYLKKNYPNHTLNELYFKSDKELGNCYLLILQKTGEKKIIKLYFDLDGNLLKNEIENL